ncbi:wax ester/triacylglycerol synthase domain-containing protein [Nocardia sp. NPDC050793]|uniref:wax ester/triacylglycerol synthase domain-containing protein n=1 Tax=Nocardia sp. NPDC050793 TaxID=3155159 RepID=UPI0033CC51BB
MAREAIFDATEARFDPGEDNLSTRTGFGTVDAEFYFMEKYINGNTSMMCLLELEREPDFDRLIGKLDIVSSITERLRQRIKPTALDLTVPTWITTDDFDIRHHVTRRELPDGSDSSTMMRIVDAIQSAAWPDGEPPWSFTLLCGSDMPPMCVIKMHHALADGATMGALWALALSAGTGSGRSANIEHRSVPSTTVAAADSAVKTPAATHTRSSRQAREPGIRERARRTVRAWQDFRAPTPTTRSRRSYLVDVDASRFQELAHRHGGGVNDLYLALSADIWANYTVAVSGAARGVTHVGMPVDLRRSSIRERGGRNLVHVATVPVDTTRPALDNVASIRIDATLAREIALSGAQPLDFGPRVWPGRLRARCAHGRSARNEVAATNLAAPANLDVGSVPVRSAYAVAPCMGAAFVFGLMRSSDQIHIALNTDDNRIPHSNAVCQSIDRAFEAIGLDVATFTRRDT